METRAIHAEISNRIHVDTDGIGDGLQRLCTLAEDAEDLGDMLNSAIGYLMVSLPDGKTNYGENGELGRVLISRLTANPGEALIEFSPSKELNKKLRLRKIPTAVQKSIGEINLRERTYDLNDGDYDEEKAVIRDTRKVMDMLGLIPKSSYIAIGP